MFLQQPQAIPHEPRLARRIAVAAMLGFFNASAQRVIGHPDHAAVFIADFNQSAFGVVAIAHEYFTALIGIKTLDASDALPRTEHRAA